MMGGKTQELSIAVPALHLGIPRSCCELLGSAVLAVWGLGVELCLSGGIITTHGNTDVGQFCTRDLGWFFVRYRLCGHLNLFIFLRVWYLFTIRAAWREYYVVSLCRNLECVLWSPYHTRIPLSIRSCGDPRCFEML